MSRLPKLSRNVWATSAASFFTDVSSEMLKNVLPLFLANVIGVRTVTIGLIEGVAESVASFVKLYAGALSDRIGRRKAVAVVGYAVSSLAKPFYYLAASWPAVGAIRWTDRVGKGIRTAPRDALIADSTPPEQRGLAFGFHRAADTAGAVLGLLVSILVVRFVQGGAIELQRSTFQVLVLASLAPAFLAVLILALWAYDIPVKRAEGAARPRITFRGLGRPFTYFLLCSALFDLGNSSDAFLVLRAQERGLTVTGVLWTLMAFNVVYTLLSTPAGSLSDRIPRKHVLLAGWAVYAGVYLGFAIAGRPSQVVALYLAYGVYYGLVMGTAKAFVADMVVPEKRATAYGAYHATLGFLNLPASILAGILWQGVGSWGGLGPSAPFWFGAACAAIASVLLMILLPGSEER